MGQVYDVTYSLCWIDDEEKVNALKELSKHIGRKFKSIDDVMAYLLTKNVEKTEEGKVQIYYAGFDASYGWESLLEECFDVMLPHLADESKFSCYPDSGYYVYAVKDGKKVLVDCDEMQTAKRAKYVKAMDLLARSINDEDILEDWLMFGVADGDIDDDTSDEELSYYCEDEPFEELINEFTKLMAKARKSGGLYIDEICAGEVKR